MIYFMPVKRHLNAEATYRTKKKRSNVGTESTVLNVTNT